MAEPLRRQTGTAATALVLLLSVLSATAGLGPAGWATGAVYLFVGGVLLTRTTRRSGRHALGPADTVTLARAVLIGGVSALVADGGHAWPVVGLAAAALTLDAVDGFVARHTRTASPFGARFDMETDAFLLLVLSVHVAADLGVWVLLVGALRYLFAAASWCAPWLRGPLPERASRKVVAAVQGVALTTACAPILPAWVSTATVAGALAALLWSFGRDTLSLWTARSGRDNSGPKDTSERPLRG